MFMLTTATSVKKREIQKKISSKEFLILQQENVLKNLIVLKTKF